MNTYDCNCVCEKPMGSVPVDRNVPPPLPKQLAYLIDQVTRCADKLNKLSAFLSDTVVDAEPLEDNCVSGKLSYAVRVIEGCNNKLDYLNEVIR